MILKDWITNTKNSYGNRVKSIKIKRDTIIPTTYSLLDFLQIDDIFTTNVLVATDIHSLDGDFILVLGGNPTDVSNFYNELTMAHKYNIEHSF